jgi:hypothetical protein
MFEKCDEGRAHKRAAADSLNSLHHRGIMQLVLDFVGPGEHGFVSTVSKAFRACYLHVAAFEGVYEAPNGTDICVTVLHFMKTCSSVLTSRSRVRLAIDLDFVLNPKSWWCQFSAGQCANMETLEELHEQYHMPYTDVVSRGGAQSGNVSKMQWLLDEQQCPQPDDLSCFAVHAPTLDMLKWLRQRGGVFTADTCAAAASSHPTLSVLQYLHSEGVALEVSTLVEAMQYEDHLPVLHWLYKHGCPLSEEAAITASELGKLDVLTWLHSKDCPCDYRSLCFEALLRRHTVVVLQWARDNAVIDWPAELLTDYLNIAGSLGNLDTAQVRNRF